MSDAQPPLWSDKQILEAMLSATNLNPDSYESAYVSVAIDACSSVARQIRNELTVELQRLRSEYAKLVRAVEAYREGQGNE